MEHPGCPICALADEEHDRIWHAYGARINLRDSFKVATRIFAGKEPEVQISEEQVAEHLLGHHWVQPTPLGKFNRSFALQEAMTSFPRHLLLLLRALYRARALSKQQIYRLFYLDHAPDSQALRDQIDRELQALTFRSYLFCHFPENKGALTFEDEGPFYFINRQAIPLVEHLEGTELEPGTYTTSIAQVQEYFLEHDTRFLDVIVRLREALYQRPFPYGQSQLTAHLGLDHWYAPAQLHCPLPSPSGVGTIEFSPAAALGFRVEVRDGSMNTLLPLWIDYDRGTEQVDEMADGLLLYAAYYGDSAYRQRFPRLAEHRTPGPLLVICENAWRCQQLAEALHERFGDQDVPVYLADRSTLMQDPYAPNILISPTQSQARFSLLERLLTCSRPLITARAFAATDHLHDPLPATLLAEAGAKAPASVSAPGKQTPKVNLSAWLGQDDS